MIVRRLTLVTLASLSLLAGALVYGGAAASAAVTHDYLSQITEVPASSGASLTGPLSGLDSMTADSGHLWIAEHLEGTTNYRVDKFDASSGAFISQLPQESGLKNTAFGIAVGHATGEAQVYVGGVETASETETVAVFSEAGSLLGTWSGADVPNAPGDSFRVSAIAVDNSATDPAAGDVYVAVGGGEQKVVDVFAPEAGGKEKYVTQIRGVSEEEPFTNPQGVAVDSSTGEVVVLDRTGSGDVVDVFEQEALGGYTFVRKITPPGGSFAQVQSLAVDSDNGEIYVPQNVVREGLGESFVDQFSSAGVYLGRITGASTPHGELSAVSIAVDRSSHDVYIGDSRKGGSAVDVFGSDVVIPDVETGAVSAPASTSATLTGTVNPDKAGGATCQFVWGVTTAFGNVTPCSSPIGEGEGAVPAQATLTGLTPDTTYHYRLQASNANGTNPGQEYQDGEFITPGPGIREEWAVNAASSSVTLGAKIDPDGPATTYYFQYGADTNYGAEVPLPPGLPVGSGHGNVEVTRHIQALQPASTYHYRVVALSELAPGDIREFDGPDHTFSTQVAGSVAALPDGRAWEMVTPPQKEGSRIEPPLEEGVIEAAAQGAAMTYLAGEPTEAEPQGYAAVVQVLSTRGADGWQTRDLAVPHTVATGAPVGTGFEYRYFSSDLSLAAVQPFGPLVPSLSALASEQTAFLHSDYADGGGEPCEVGCYTPLVTGKPGAADVPPGTTFGEEENGECYGHSVFCGPGFVAATPDMRHILVEVQKSSGSTFEGGLYEWTAGQLTPVGVATKYSGFDTTHMRNGLSSDGSRIFLTGFASGGENQLAMENLVTHREVRVDTVKGGSGDGPEKATPVFQAASSDGSVVFFTDEKELTPESGSGEGGDLYECRIAEVAGQPQCELTDLTPVTGGEPAEVRGTIAGASEDGSYVYFVANGVLAQGARPGRCIIQGVSPEGATCNLYMRHEGVTRLVAVLSQEDRPDWAGNGLVGLSARVSPNGRWLAFMAQQDLTGYDTNAAAGDGPSEEVYLYDAVNHKLSCASCNPTGALPQAARHHDGLDQGLVGRNENWKEEQPLAADIPPWVPINTSQALYQPRYLSDSGRLLFDSSDALVPQDVNGTEDVYEYEPPGVGACMTSSATFSALSGGCVGLISSGASAEESVFLDASESGGDVFFMTAAKLSGADFDSSYDIYDAHECTSTSPCIAQPQVLPPPCSTGDACKPASSPQPSIFGSPASSTFAGSGNVVPGSSRAVVGRRSLSRMQKLARALKACRREKGRRRAACARQAKARYAPEHAGRIKAKKKGGR